MSLYKDTTPLKPLVSIPVPCHEDWDKMTPAEKGSYCAVCKKVVRDFSKQTDEEINNYLLERRGEKVCGRFRADQVVPNVKLGFSFDLIPNFLSPLKKFALAAIFVFGSSLFTITSAKGENVISFNIELSMNAISTDHFSVPKPFNKTEMDSIMSSYDSLVALLHPIPYSDTDQTEIAEMPPLPDTSKSNLAYNANLSWFITDQIFIGGNMVAINPNPQIVFYGDICMPKQPIYDPFVSDVSYQRETEEPRPKPTSTITSSTTSEEKQKEAEENDRKRDFPKNKTNDDLIDDSDFPSLRREKK